MTTSPHIPGLFITGTDTGVGKTHIAALIARALVAQGLRVGVYKPAASGCQRKDGRLISDDAVALWEAAGRPGTLDDVCPQCFEAPLAPHLAARAEGKQIDRRRLRTGIEYWQSQSQIILVEGAGGLMSPMGDDDYVADLAYEIGFPLIVVSRNVLGTINSTLQTLIAASVYRRGLLASLGTSCPTVGGDFIGNAGSTVGGDSVGDLHTVGGDSVGDCISSPAGTSPASTRSLHVAGVVLNHPTAPTADDASLATNRIELAARCPSPLLAEVVYGSDQFDRAVDWPGLAR